MPTTPFKGKLIYHLTSVENLRSIFENGLSSRLNVENFDDIAEQEIISHRERMGLNEYVPFHFFAGTPFAGAVQKANPSKDFVFITVQRAFAEKKNFKILTQHPLSVADNIPLSYADGMRAIDWETMELRDYNNRECFEICMAECLAPKKVFPGDFFCIYTKNEKIKDDVEYLRTKFVKNGSFYVDVNLSFFIK